MKQQKNPFDTDPATFNGFDIPIQPSHKKRLDRLVNDYECTIINDLNREYTLHTKWADRLADKIAYFGGSWKFIITFAIFLAMWMIWNIMIFTHHFDEPPFILLNLVLSFIAAFQAPIILMSQNRHAARDKREAVIDFAINYKAEREIDDMQKHLHRLETEIATIKQLLQQAPR